MLKHTTATTRPKLRWVEKELEDRKANWASRMIGWCSVIGLYKQEVRASSSQMLILTETYLCL